MNKKKNRRRTRTEESLDGSYGSGKRKVEGERLRRKAVTDGVCVRRCYYFVDGSTCIYNYQLRGNIFLKNSSSLRERESTSLFPVLFILNVITTKKNPLIFSCLLPFPLPRYYFIPPFMYFFINFTDPKKERLRASLLIDLF